MTFLPFSARLPVVLVSSLAVAAVCCADKVVTGRRTAPPRTAHIAAAAPANTVTASMRPLDRFTVGVAMPIMLRFTADVVPEHRRDVLDRVRVTSVPAMRGAWHWFSSREVHWRPVSYWSPGTHVAVTADLNGVPVGHGTVGRGRWRQTFTVGRKHVSIVDAVHHRMRVYDGGTLIHTWPLSAGRRDLQTIGGILFVRYKETDVLMDSTSIGIPRDAWDGYYEHVFWDTAISSDGYYVHAAPWSLAAQGVTNVSHGCVNLSTENAKTFFDFSLVGDVVIVRGSTRRATAEDGEGDWQMTFDQFASTGAVTVTPRTVS